MDELLRNISVNDLEKLRVLFSMMRMDEVKQVVTLRVFVDEYLTYIHSNRSSSYCRSIKISFDHLSSFFNLQKTISSIILRDVESFLADLQQKVNKGFTVYFRNLKAAFNKAKEWGYVSENYFTKVKLPKKQKLAPGFITSNELQGIRDKIKSPIVKDVVVFAFYTGMRLGEIVNLRWKNVDLENVLITVGDDEFVTKGRKQRFIPMSSEVVEMLERMESLDGRGTPSFVLPLKKGGDGSRFVFCKENGEKFTGNYLSKRFKKACKTVGLDNSIHFHSLRHSFASNLVQRGIPLYTIKELLGHSSISTTEIYSHLNMESLREAVKMLDTSTSSSTGSELRLSASYSNEMLDMRQKQKLILPTPFIPLPRGDSNTTKIFRIEGGSLPLQGGERK